MKKVFFLVLFFTSVFTGISQSTYKTTKGEIHFNASTPLEDIDAKNNQVNAIFKTETGEFAAVLLIKDFKFKKRLMQEHFNENYMESETYPKAYFSGSLTGFNNADLTEVPRVYRLQGKMVIHGTEKNIATEVTLQKMSDTIQLNTGFIVAPEDYNIRVPRLLFTKIAKEVQVDVALNMAMQ